jgi:hypothetical protein
VVFTIVWNPIAVFCVAVVIALPAPTPTYVDLPSVLTVLLKLAPKDNVLPPSGVCIFPPGNVTELNVTLLVVFKDWFAPGPAGP